MPMEGKNLRVRDYAKVFNRDLKTLKVDIHKGHQVLGSIPSNMPVIIESGIEKRQDIEEFIRKGASGFVVGSAISRKWHEMLAGKIAREDFLFFLKELSSCCHRDFNG